MDLYVDPGLAAHAQGVELRIIELTEQIGRARRWPGYESMVEDLRHRRRRLQEELARTSAAMADTRSSAVEIDAERVQRRSAEVSPADDPGVGSDSRRTA